ncbi:unnamed protein product [Onchocerca flexuosa]|uniref:SAM-dependent methyltransferase n=1 Tax=Onchocerca flexuosa TaxID=387005 RepID=A0A183HS03_9BILA|nr:unnamed protein product [Onchocerca flexuosa]
MSRSVPRNYWNSAYRRLVPRYFVATHRFMMIVIKIIRKVA